MADTTAADSALITGIITALGGPAAVGALLLALLKRSMAKIDVDQSSKFTTMAGRFDVVADEMKEVIESNKLQGAALADIRTRLAIYETQAQTMARAIEEFRQMDKQLTLMQSKVDAAFRNIDDTRARMDRIEGRFDRAESEIAVIRDTMRHGSK